MLKHRQGLDLRDSQVQPFPLIQWAAMHLLVHLLNQLYKPLGQLLFVIILHNVLIVQVSPNIILMRMIECQ